MKSAEERIILMHRKANVLRKKRDHALLLIWGTASVCLFLCFLSVMTPLCLTGHGLAEATATASSLLSDSAGGYVLIGVIFFMVGVLTTVFFIRKRGRKTHQHKM